jgi:ABC-type glutathione transport system ATPase component
MPRTSSLSAADARETADFSYVMDTGEIVRSGPAAVLISNPEMRSSELTSQQNDRLPVSTFISKSRGLLKRESPFPKQ